MIQLLKGECDLLQYLKHGKMRQAAQYFRVFWSGSLPRQIKEISNSPLRMKRHRHRGDYFIRRP
jgi:hypothetical protein